MDTEDDRPDQGEGSVPKPEQLRDVSGSEDESSSPQQVPPLETAGESETVYMSRADQKEPSSDPPDVPDYSVPVIDSFVQGDSGAADVSIDSINTMLSDASFDVTPDLPPLGLGITSDDKPEQPALRISDGIQEPLASDPVPPLPTSGEKPSRNEDAANLGPMSFYKRKNLEKGREVPGLEKDDDGNYRQSGTIGSGEERDESGLKAQRSFDMRSLDMPSGGPLAVDMQPDIIPEVGSDGASSFKPDGIDSDSMKGSVQSAADSVDTLNSGIIDVLTRLTMNMRKANDIIRQLQDKLEVEDHRDEF